MEEDKQTQEERPEEGREAQTSEEARIAEVLGKKEGKEGFLHRHFYLVGEVWSFMKVRKKWWLLPIIITLALVGLLIIFGQASPLSPFIYALF
ncbi:hypothetical protein HYU16_03420 [Candidatus Woesearchaeota archaeon]|nr:hypothetical protein [Candidatus Woesearchaeota archaeon]